MGRCCWEPWGHWLCYPGLSPSQAPRFKPQLCHFQAVSSPKGPLCEPPGVATTKGLRLKTTGIYCLPVLEARSPNSTRQGPEAPGEGPSCLFLLPGVPGVPWLVAASLQPPPLSSPGLPVFLPIVFPVCVSGTGRGSCRTSTVQVRPIRGPCCPGGFCLRTLALVPWPGVLVRLHSWEAPSPPHCPRGAADARGWELGAASLGGRRSAFITGNPAGTLVSSPSGIHLFSR